MKNSAAPATPTPACQYSRVAVAVPRTPRKPIVASGRPAIATTPAVIRIVSTIHRPSTPPALAAGPNSKGATDQIAPSTMPSTTVTRTSARVADSRIRDDSRRKATPTAAAATSAPQLSSCQGGTKRSSTIAIAPTATRFAASRNSASWRPEFTWAARIGPQSVESAGSYRPSSARMSIRGRANWEDCWCATRPG